MLDLSHKFMFKKSLAQRSIFFSVHILNTGRHIANFTCTSSNFYSSFWSGFEYDMHVQGSNQEKTKEYEHI